MTGNPSMADRWLVMAVLALAAALVLSVLAWFAVGREMVEVMSEVRAGDGGEV